MPISAKGQCVVWDNTTHVKILHHTKKCTVVRCSALKYTKRRMQFGTQSLRYISMQSLPCDWYLGFNNVQKTA